jgi:16S rRNA (adenine1518-N6/adenine1519-N6)-dimethyltransferase
MFKAGQARVMIMDMPRKHLGQHFLNDPLIIEGIVRAAHLEPSDFVVEIGPGPGRMTRMLARRVAKLLAIELDEHLYEKLRKELAGHDNIELALADALDYRYETLPDFKVVANIRQ